MSTRPEPPLPRNFMRACVLLLLREAPAHGYDLLERLRAFGFTVADPGGLYRALRAMEQDGLVHSAWEPSANGPDRRIYEITRAGMEDLHDRAGALAETHLMIDRLLSRYEEFVALQPAEEREPAGRSSGRRGD